MIIIWFELQLLDAVFEALDVDEKGELDYSVYMREVLGQMNECRKTKVRKVSQPWLKKVSYKNHYWREIGRYTGIVTSLAEQFLCNLKIILKMIGNTSPASKNSLSENQT